MATATPASAGSTAAPTSTTAVTQGGRTVINDGVIAKIAGIATREVSGVFALGGGAARALGAFRDAINQTDLTQGVNVEVGERQVAVDITIVAEYPQPLQTVADEVRANVYRAIGTLVGMEVTEVNVTINDVHIPGEDDTAQAPEARVQ
jgi:uncharacterized alkaline shock family protein YloU